MTQTGFNVLGLDLSLNHVGVVVLNEKKIVYYTTIVPIVEKKIEGKKKIKKEKLKGLTRQFYIVNQIKLIVDLFHIDYAAIENYSFQSFGSSITKLAEVGGVVRFILSEKGIPFQVFSPQTLKKFLIGHLKKFDRPKRLTKKEKSKLSKEERKALNNEKVKLRKLSKLAMLEQAKHQGGEEFKTDDEADAYALAKLKFGIECYKAKKDLLGWGEKANHHVKTYAVQDEVIKQWSKVKQEVISLPQLDL